MKRLFEVKFYTHKTCCQQVPCTLALGTCNKVVTEKFTWGYTTAEQAMEQAPFILGRKDSTLISVDL